MKTKNIYSYPINKKNIQNVITKESPGHILYHNEKTGFKFDLRNATDFLCDEGTSVIAALDGEVIAVIDNVTKNYDGMNPPIEDILSENEQVDNEIVIKHTNGEFTDYCHLKHKGVLVKPGQKVKAGDTIGYSGDTGWSIKPHLHFVVFRFLKEKPVKELESLKIQFKE
ncbi:MAG: M23 family metallopeptidase [Nanoarchaeota archaeon]|nr:M23 family metallopeptidase [Nanoarchaeota archaeon]